MIFGQSKFLFPKHLQSHGKDYIVASIGCTLTIKPQPRNYTVIHFTTRSLNLWQNQIDSGKGLIDFGAYLNNGCIGNLWHHL